MPHYPIRPKNDLQLQVKDKRFVVLCRTPEHLAVYLQKIASLLGIVSTYEIVVFVRMSRVFLAWTVMSSCTCTCLIRAILKFLCQLYLPAGTVKQ
jgi:hypothetical protein